MGAVASGACLKLGRVAKHLDRCLARRGETQLDRDRDEIVGEHVASALHVGRVDGAVVDAHVLSVRPTVASSDDGVAAIDSTEVEGEAREGAEELQQSREADEGVVVCLEEVFERDVVRDPAERGKHLYA